MGAFGTAAHWGCTKSYGASPEAALTRLSYTQQLHTYQQYTDYSQKNPHPQTETNEQTKSLSKLFNHKQKVVEGKPRGLVFNIIGDKHDVIYGTRAGSF